ncbi:MAG: pilus assembly protein PilM [Lachnospiraceae bacterium]|nr:pilus assembly protein PilM [Lachnospiraceae bacterium]
MEDNKKYPERMVFGLDIGTRSIVGSVGFMDHKKFKVAAQYTKEHDTRAMIDGQIHDIAKVSQTIYQVKTSLEMMLGRGLNEVCIAAAGRVLKTVTMHVEQTFEEETLITNEHVYSLDMLGVENAHEKLSHEESNIRFYCVGYTVIKYYLNDFDMNFLEGHKARKVGADVLATFLPEEVVDSLYSAVEDAGLEVANLTLEPIAAIQLAIPEQFRLLNIALVDIGAGTSDICITKEGSITAYGMIPIAGDELTETLVKEYLVDFATAEKIKLASGKKKAITYKDIMGLSHKIEPAAVLKVMEPVLSRMAANISEKIKELNGGKSVSAVFVVGGGGKVSGFTRLLAEELDIPQERVALRGAEVMGNIEFLNQDIKKDSLLVTPIGICLNYYNQKNSFIFVYFNGQRIKLYDNDRLTVMDAAIQADYPNECLFPRRGKELTFTVNGKTQVVRGESGEGAVILLNGEEVSLQASLKQNDRIIIRDSTVGAPAKMVVEALPEYTGSITFEVNDRQVVCPKFAQINGKLESGYYEIKEHDKIEFLNYYTVEQVFRFLDIDAETMKVYVNNRLASLEDKVYENFSFRFEPLTGTYEDLVESTEA